MSNIQKLYSSWRRSILALFFLGGLSGCAKEDATDERVYFNDFESGNLMEIEGAALTNFNNSTVIGRYNAGGFQLNLSGLPGHDLVEVTFDLYIHDSWDGNMQRAENDSGPDIWKFLADGETYIYTTFSNSGCAQYSYCDPQSYPYNYQNNSTNPRTGATPINLPGACFLSHVPNGTSLYKIKKRFVHSSNTLSLEFLDELKQTNANNPLCDESWSLDNLEVRAIRY